jgi:hypothetical protein
LKCFKGGRQPSVYKKLLEQKQGDTDEGNTALITREEIESFTKWPEKSIRR